MIAIVLLLASLLIPERAKEITVDRIEVNTLVDECGKETITQVVFWNWRRWLCKPQFVCEGWRMYRPEQLKQARGKWIWYPDRGPPVVARELIRTRTRRDPEKANREVYPVERRRLGQ